MDAINKCDGSWAEVEKPNYEVSGDIRDIAETIKDLVPGIDGEALSDELIRLSEEVQCMEESPVDNVFMAEADKHTLNVLKSRHSVGPGTQGLWTINPQVKG